MYLGGCPPDDERTFEKYPKRKRGQYGKATSTGHSPPHAEMAREKHARRWVTLSSEPGVCGRSCKRRGAGCAWPLMETLRHVAGATKRPCAGRRSRPNTLRTTESEWGSGEDGGENQSRALAHWESRYAHDRDAPAASSVPDLQTMLDSQSWRAAHGSRLVHGKMSGCILMVARLHYTRTSRYQGRARSHVPAHRMRLPVTV